MPQNGLPDLISEDQVGDYAFIGDITDVNILSHIIIIKN